jgi:hypothetical protein
MFHIFYVPACFYVSLLFYFINSVSLIISIPVTFQDTSIFINYVLNVIIYLSNIKSLNFRMIPGIKACFSSNIINRLVCVMRVEGSVFIVTQARIFIWIVSMTSVCRIRSDVHCQVHSTFLRSCVFLLDTLSEARYYSLYLLPFTVGSTLRNHLATLPVSFLRCSYASDPESCDCYFRRRHSSDV